MIKTIATDLDGTLFYPKRKGRLLTRNNTNFLKKFVKENNGHVIVVSGRNYTICERIAKKIDYPAISMVACNGSAIFHEGKLIYEDPIAKEDVKFLHEKFVKEQDASVVMYMLSNQDLIVVPLNMSKAMVTVGKIGMSLQGAYKENYIFGEDAFLKALENPNVKFYKVMPCYDITGKTAEKARLRSISLREELGDRFEILWSSNSVEIMKKHVNKANALKRLLNVLQLEESFTAVIGDSGNDVPLFEAFENSFCMENAHDEVKVKAKNTVKGVYEIEKYL